MLPGNPVGILLNVYVVRVSHLNPIHTITRMNKNPPGRLFSGIEASL